MNECFFEEQFHLYLQDLPSINFLLFFLFWIWSFKPSAFYFQMNNLQTYKTTYSFLPEFSEFTTIFIPWNHYKIKSVWNIHMLVKRNSWCRSCLKIDSLQVFTWYSFNGYCFFMNFQKKIFRDFLFRKLFISYSIIKKQKLH